MAEKTKKRLSGFTLVELVVSMAILSIMAAITIVSLSGTKTKQEVEGAARELAAAIREAQNYALTGRSITGGLPCQFRITAVALSGSYTLQQTDSTGCGTVAGSVSYTLPNSVQFSSGTGVWFDVPRGEPRNSAGTEIGTSGVTHVDFSFAKNGSTAHVCVYPLGRIEEKPIGVNCV